MKNRNRNITDVLSALLVCLFLYAAISKILVYPTFTEELHKNLYLKHFAGLIAVAVPLAELIITGLLVFKRTQLNGLYSSFVLLSIFSIYIILLYLSGKPLPCSCGGFIGLLTWPQHLLLNLIFILLAAAGITLFKRTRKINS